MKILTHFEQGSQEWFEIRLGKLTSSCIADAVAQRKRKPKDGAQVEPLKGYLDLRRDLAVERLTKKPIDHFVSRWMREGKEKEPLARACYEIRKDAQVSSIGFAMHDMEWCGASPDGMVGYDGLVEFKCPKASTHAEYIVLEGIPEEYVPQLTWELACTGRQWVDFVSYQEDFPEPHDLIVHRMHRNNDAIAIMEAQATVFLKEVANYYLRLTHGLEGLLRASLVPRAQIPAWAQESTAEA